MSHPFIRQYGSDPKIPFNTVVLREMEHEKMTDANVNRLQESNADPVEHKNENMEVHHHAHHKEKRTWKSYFWEFLMLFLAVFLGFLAENQREHFIEHK